MPTSQDPTSIGSDPDVAIDRRVVEVATITAAAFFVVLSGTWLVSGDTRFGLQSLTPLVVAAIGVGMLRGPRPQALVQLLVAIGGLIFYVTVAPEVPGDPLLGLLIMAIAGSALVRRRTTAYIASAATVIGATAFAWAPPGTTGPERPVLAFTAAASFAVGAWLISWLKGQSASDRQRLREIIAAKDQFVASVSHELRTPLTVVVGLAHELRSHHRDFTTAELEEFTGLLVSESTDVADIVEDLLVAARADVGTLVLDLQEVDLVAAVRRELTDTCFPGEVITRTDSVWIRGDDLRLRQIIRNLTNNAARYGGPNVRVVVSAGETDGIVEVRDDGPPLDPPEQARIFDAYHRAASIEGKPGSVGLGLTVSRQLARLMGGDVIYSHDGETVFTLSIPSISPAGAQAA